MKSDQHHHLAPAAEELTSDTADWFKKYWSRIALGVVLAALIAIVIYQRVHASGERALAAKGNVALARYNIQQLEVLNPLQMAGQDQAATLRQQFADTARDALGAARQNSTDPSLLSEADVAEGDLNWTLANLPALPGAATRPSLALPKSESEYLDQAAAAYKQVLQKYPNESLAVVSAHFGLGAISENRLDWAEAKTQYQTVADMKNIPQTFRDQAQSRIKELAKLQEPVYIAPATQPVAEASTRPIVAGPAAPKKLAATTAPSTRP